MIGDSGMMRRRGKARLSAHQTEELASLPFSVSGWEELAAAYHSSVAQTTSRSFGRAIRRRSERYPHGYFRAPRQAGYDDRT